MYSGGGAYCCCCCFLHCLSIIIVYNFVLSSRHFVRFFAHFINALLKFWGFSKNLIKELSRGKRDCSMAPCFAVGNYLLYVCSWEVNNFDIKVLSHRKRDCLIVTCFFVGNCFYLYILYIYNVLLRILTYKFCPTESDTPQKAQILLEKSMSITYS